MVYLLHNPVHNLSYYTASSVSGQDDSNPVLWLATRGGKIEVLSKKTARRVPKKNFAKTHIINPLLTKLVRSRWLDFSLVLFFFGVFMDRNGIKVHEHAEKEVVQKPIFTIWQSSNEANLSVLIDSFLVGISPHYMASSVSGKEEPNRSLCRIGYPIEQDEATLPDYPPCPARKISSKAK